ncbi:hypothetical protein IRJ41_013994 [Triplophysa rosa]|uniref:Uncharacterized protein n=1 Tax=Triplophysa rosa TaxID=992332 RepID=A0A9W7T4I0_TRIRA|nr:hypothetical protein IRJ41_013994 [Triplophysa rosa]
MQEVQSDLTPTMPAGTEPLQSGQDSQDEGVKRKQAYKRKHIQVDLDHLQTQMRGMQETIKSLVEAQQGAAEPRGLGLPKPKWPCRHPDDISVIASGRFGRDERPEHSETDDISDSDMGEYASQASDAMALDPSDRAVIARAAVRAKLPPQAATTSTSVFDRGPQHHKSEGLPILPDFIAELQSSWKAPSSTALPRTQLSNLAGAATQELTTAPQIGPTFAMLTGAVARTGRDATHPHKQGRMIDSQLRKAYQASALSARLACTNSLLLVYLESLLQDSFSSSTEEESIPESLRVVDMLLRGTSAHAQALGQSMANVVQARRQVWLSHANLLDQDCMAVIAAPLVPGEVFGTPAEAALEQSRRTRELTRSVVRAPATRSPRTFAGSSSWARAESSSRAFVGHRHSAAQRAPTGPSQGAGQSFRRTQQAKFSTTRGGRNRP